MRIEEYLDRLKKLTRTETDTALAEALGVAKQTVSSWRKRGAVPLDVELQLTNRFGPGAAFSPEFEFATSSREERVALAVFLMIFDQEKRRRETGSDPKKYEDWASAYIHCRESLRDNARAFGFKGEDAWPTIVGLKAMYDAGALPEVRRQIDIFLK